MIDAVTNRFYWSTTPRAPSDRRMMAAQDALHRTGITAARSPPAEPRAEHVQDQVLHRIAAARARSPGPGASMPVLARAQTRSLSAPRRVRRPGPAELPAVRRQRQAAGSSPGPGPQTLRRVRRGQAAVSGHRRRRWQSAACPSQPLRRDPVRGDPANTVTDIMFLQSRILGPSRGGRRVTVAVQYVATKYPCGGRGSLAARPQADSELRRH